LALMVSSLSAQAQTAAADARILMGLINQARAASGAQPLAIDSRAARAAQEQANAMARNGRVSHDGFDERMRAAGIRGASAENVAAGHRDIHAAFADWQSSSLHNGNMLNARMRRLGLGRQQGADGRGYWALVLY
ncbi:MAG: CAP domain-containing protein, partial [Beijerinckiaceae bacterium]